MSPPPRFFGARLGYQVYYGHNTVSGSYGTAILSRVPFANARSFFTFSNEEEVGTALVEVELGGKRVAFFNAHPSGALPRKCQAEEMVRQAARYERVIAVGDFNSRPGEAPYEIVTRHLKDGWLEKFPNGIGWLHPTLRPHAGTRRHGSSGTVLPDDSGTIELPDRIDHIFLSQNCRVVEAFYLPAPDSQTDHPAHWAVLEWD